MKHWRWKRLRIYLVKLIECVHISLKWKRFYLLTYAETNYYLYACVVLFVCISFVFLCVSSLFRLRVCIVHVPLIHACVDFYSYFVDVCCNCFVPILRHSCSFVFNFFFISFLFFFVCWMLLECFPLEWLQPPYTIFHSRLSL